MQCLRDALLYGIFFIMTTTLIPSPSKTLTPDAVNSLTLKEIEDLLTIFKSALNANFDAKGISKANAGPKQNEARMPRFRPVTVICSYRPSVGALYPSTDSTGSANVSRLLLMPE